MQIEEVIKYWLTSAEDDQRVAEHLFEKGDYAYTLFFGHLYLEKLLKAIVVKISDTQAPAIHNLRVLSEMAKLPVSDEQLEFLIKVQDYNLRARYPDFKFDFKKRCTKEFTKKELERIIEFGKWLKEKI